MKLKAWSPIKKPACDCTETLSYYCATLASAVKPKIVLPGVECPCGRTWLRLQDKALFITPESMWK